MKIAMSPRERLLQTLRECQYKRERERAIRAILAYLDDEDITVAFEALEEGE